MCLAQSCVDNYVLWGREQELTNERGKIENK